MKTDLLVVCIRDEIDDPRIASYNSRILEVPYTSLYSSYYEQVVFSDSLEGVLFRGGNIWTFIRNCLGNIIICPWSNLTNDERLTIRTAMAISCLRLFMDHILPISKYGYTDDRYYALEALSG